MSAAAATRRIATTFSPARRRTAARTPAAEDMSCSNWTSSGDGGAMVGHHDRMGGGNTSWNAAHRSRGCSQEQLKGTGGDGLFVLLAEK